MLREANSVIAGTDALAGVISITSRRGRTRVPEALVSLDGGNFGTNHESVGLGGTVRRFDYFGEFAHFGTDNDLPNNAYRNKTFAGRFGVAVGRNTDLSGTVRWIDRRFESPNGVSFYTHAGRCLPDEPAVLRRPRQPDADHHRSGRRRFASV